MYFVEGIILFLSLIVVDVEELLDGFPSAEGHCVCYFGHSGGFVPKH